MEFVVDISSKLASKFRNRNNLSRLSKIINSRRLNQLITKQYSSHMTHKKHKGAQSRTSSETEKIGYANVQHLP